MSNVNYPLLTIRNLYLSWYMLQFELGNGSQGSSEDIVLFRVVVSKKGTS